MPSFVRDDVTIEYQVMGAGDEPPILLFAPGGMKSTIDMWSTKPWNPLMGLEGFFRVAMDQRNAGKSTAPIRPGDGWASYTADQVALLDHLRLEQVQVIGMCIGGPYALGLIKAAPERVKSAVMFQPIGLHENRHLFFDLFDQWSSELSEIHPEADADTWLAFRQAMFGGDFLFNTSREELEGISTPLLVLMGDDPYHPSVISREVVRRAPNATLIEQWREEPHRETAIAAVKAFLDEHR